MLFTPGQIPKLMQTTSFRVFFFFAFINIKTTPFESLITVFLPLAKAKQHRKHEFQQLGPPSDTSKRKAQSRY